MKLLRIWSGPMSASKSEGAIQVAVRYQRHKLKVILVRPSKSRRSHEQRPGTLTTKAGKSFPSVDVDSAMDIPKHCKDADVVWIDEPALFDQEQELAAVVAELRKKSIILISGLGATSELEPFGTSMPRLMAVADQINWSKADCDLCGNHDAATRSLYIGSAAKTEQVCVGGEESYVPTCVDCWNRFISYRPTERRAAIQNAPLVSRTPGS